MSPAELLALAEENLTLSVQDAALALGVSDDVIYRVIRETGTLDGIPVAHVGRRVRVPARLLAERLGVDVRPKVVRHGAKGGRR